VDSGAWEIDPELQTRLERAGAEFLAGFFETELSQKPENLAALSELGHLYTRLGRVAEGLKVDRELVRRMPGDPTARYNLACSLAQSGELDAAFEELGRALERGYRDAEHLALDADLAALRGDPRFEALLARLAELRPDA
jgi:Flp pilus assembly protein TadD